MIAMDARMRKNLSREGDAQPEDSQEKHRCRQQSEGSNCDRNVHAFLGYRFRREQRAVTAE